ncbi:MAG: FHA domain-containing protein [Desulfobacterium sp.]|nr:FHA domain-containing protein [Desulfobacterium sp.]
MPSLLLKFKEEIVRKYPLEKGSSITLGRKETNDVVIENLAVSGNHAKIDSVGEGFLFTDLQSKNGSFVNEQLVKSHYLNHGDVITIGKHTLEFRYADHEKKPDSASAGMDQTMIMDTEKHRKMLASTMPDLHPGLNNVGPIGMLSDLSGNTGDVILTKKMTKIGKDSSSDIVISGLLSGKNAATISRRPDGYYLSYVGGMAKPKVNDETIKGSKKLNEYDLLEIGSLKMQFTIKKK